MAVASPSAQVPVATQIDRMNGILRADDEERNYATLGARRGPGFSTDFRVSPGAKGGLLGKTSVYVRLDSQNPKTRAPRRSSKIRKIKCLSSLGDAKIFRHVLECPMLGQRQVTMYSLTHPRDMLSAGYDTRRRSVTVAILMCTYNGEKYLAEQLDSIVAQEDVDWRVYISDDGSIDTTLRIVQEYVKAFPEKIAMLQGPKKGVACNFWSLINNESIKADFYAFSDQDDQWCRNKLKAGVSFILERTSGPAMYCSRTKLMSANGEIIGASPLFSKSPAFENALVQNVGSGNTMILNREAICILRNYRVTDHNIVMHDWLAYLLITASGGAVVYDNIPRVLYRQHGGNVIGANSGVLAKFRRLVSLFQGEHAQWYSAHCGILIDNKALLGKHALEKLTLFNQLRSAKGINSIRILKKSGIYRQTTSGNLSLLFAAWAGKL
jgi:glycosyltransferase involved in cell wall biosynthesis